MCMKTDEVVQEHREEQYVPFTVLAGQFIITIHLFYARSICKAKYYGKASKGGDFREFYSTANILQYTQNC